jgi:flagellar motor protein MotB
MSWLWLTWIGCPKGGEVESDLVKQLNLEVLALQEHLRHSQEELQICASGGEVDNPLYTQLKKVLSAENVDVLREGSATRVVINASHVFVDPFKMTWRSEGEAPISLLATALQLNAEMEVMIVGHTSDRELPRSWARVYDSNVDWSARMALALANRFAADFELDRARFTIGGRGPFSPRDSNDIEAGRDRNQRLEVWIFPRDGPLPNPG